MKLLLAIIFLLPFIFLGYMLSRLDRFLAWNARSNDKSIVMPAAIVLGKTAIAKETAELLKKSRIRVIALAEPFLSGPEQNLCYLFALSGSDTDNIIMCSTGRKLYGIGDIISICNDSRNEEIFKNEKIPYIMADKANLQVIYESVLQETRYKLTS
jgi:hypothetical protein